MQDHLVTRQKMTGNRERKGEQKAWDEYYPGSGHLHLNNPLDHHIFEGRLQQQPSMGL